MNHRAAVGGMWDKIGKLQFDFMVAQGLEPAHNLLDIGCGSLRGGLHFIRYLDIGHYYGVEKEQVALAWAGSELDRAGLAYRRPQLKQDGAFDFGHFGTSFDFALAQSVFTHLSLNDIIVCLMRLGRVLTVGGRFFATFFEGYSRMDTNPIAWQTDDGQEVTTYPTLARSMHYPFDYFEWAAVGSGLRVEYIGEWGHPRKQRMMVFTRWRE
jgi:SAM-dependent methyltransferase